MAKGCNISQFYTFSANESQAVLASSVVLTTGTFLSGSLFVGQSTMPGGRIGDAPSVAGLSHTLRERLGLRMGRLRTGTPPRIVKESVDLSLALLHPPDSSPTPFSFLNKHTRCKVHTFKCPIFQSLRKIQGYGAIYTCSENCIDPFRIYNALFQNLKA